MYKAMTAPVLESVGEGKVALQSVSVETEIENLMCEVTINQVYSNQEQINIEAVYTFPLPLDAVLLNMTIKTGSKQLKGVVIEKADAVDRYEEAVTDGDTAIMLEQISPGLYTMNTGNLMPGETIEISLTYAELFKWRNNSLRFFLPTTISPRYGNPENIDIQPHQTPEYNLMNENSFTITISISGTLSKACIESPSHKIISEECDGKTIVSLKKGQALMDRDFVLNFFMENGEKNSIQMESDGDDHVVLASFYPRFPSASHKKPLCITIIVDCSGSMCGDSITHARKALHDIFELLCPGDKFNVIRFGSTCEMLFSGLTPVNKENLKKAENLLETLDADMGGTEIRRAVVAAIKQSSPDNSSGDVLLITDGEVWEWEGVMDMAAESGFRFYTVGVGSSVSEAFVQNLADTTGGACELVSPNEDMSEKIVRHFKRICLPRTDNVKIVWSDEPDEVIPAHTGPVYDGDTLHIFGRFKIKPSGDVELQTQFKNGVFFSEKLCIGEGTYSEKKYELPGTIARMAAADRIKAMTDPEKIVESGVKYQLMTPFTNYLTVDVKNRDKKAHILPVIRKTPQMLAAGWGGSGSVVFEEYMPSCLQMSYGAREFNHEEASEHPEFARRKKDVSNMDDNRHFEFPAYSLKRRQTKLPESFDPVLSLNDLKSYNIPDEITALLMELICDGIDEQTVVIIFLYLLLQHRQFRPELNRASRRIILKAYKMLADVPTELYQRIKMIEKTYFQTIKI